MHIVDKLMSWGMTFLSWYVVYVLVAGGAFAAWLVYRVWLQDTLKARHGQQASHHRPID